MPGRISGLKNIDVDTSIYASGDALGTVQSVTIPLGGVIESIVVNDRAKASVNLDVVFFKAAIAETAENGAFDPTDAELTTSLGSVLVSTWKAFANSSQGVAANIGLVYETLGGTIYFQCVTRGAPTYVATTDVEVILGIVY